jgi:phosphonatase-like hydrolase
MQTSRIANQTARLNHQNIIRILHSHTMQIKLVVLDIAGTTVRDDNSVNRCLREALASKGIAVTPQQVNAVMGLPKPIAIGSLLEQHEPQPKSSLTQRATTIHNEFLERMVSFYQTAAEVEPMPYTIEALGEIKAAGLRLALDTGFSRPILDAILERLGWEDSGLFDVTVASDEVPRGRPFPDLIFKAMSLTRVTDLQAVAKVGDTPADLREGTAAGCALVIGVTNGTHTREQLALHSHTHLISSLKELPALVLRKSL